MSKNNLLKQFVSYVDSNKSEIPIKSENIVRIMTFNVHMWRDYKNEPNTDDVISLINSSNADIVGLTESVFFGDKKADKIIREHFKGTNYKYFALCNPKYGINIMISKYPITNVFVRPLGLDPSMKVNRYALLCRIALTDKSIDIVLTHLDVYDETEKTRTEQIMKILEKTDNDIVMGDFNSLRKDDYTEDEWNKIVEINKSRNTETVCYVTDSMVLNDFVTDKINMSVWSMRRVDYIYINKNSPYEIIKTFTIPTTISDHFPIVSDIKLK